MQNVLKYQSHWPYPGDQRFLSRSFTEQSSAKSSRVFERARKASGTQDTLTNKDWTIPWLSGLGAEPEIRTSLVQVPLWQTSWGWNKKRWNNQHVASVGQGKNLSSRRESNPWPSVNRSDALTTKLLADSWRAEVIFTLATCRIFHLFYFFSELKIHHLSLFIS